jgi:hypothetical protein
MRDDCFDAVVLRSCCSRGLPLPRGVPIVGIRSTWIRRSSPYSPRGDAWGRRVHAAPRSGVRRAARSGVRRGTSRVLSPRRCAIADILMRELGVSHVTVGIRTALTSRSSRRHQGGGQAATILFLGLIRTTATRAAVRWFLDEVFPAVLRRVPTATLVVAGAHRLAGCWRELASAFGNGTGPRACVVPREARAFVARSGLAEAHE